MQNKIYKIENRPQKRFLFAKTVFWLQFIIFGGWNGLQIILQPQDLTVFVAERGFLDNFFYLTAYCWRNIPLLYMILLAIGVIWTYRAVALDRAIINSMKKKDNISVIPYKDKDNIDVFITSITTAIWVITLLILYFLPYWDFGFLTDMFYDITGIDRLKEPLYLLIVLATASVTIFMRTQLLLFYEGGNEVISLKRFIISFSTEKAIYIKSYLLILLTITVSSLIYKQFVWGVLGRLRIAFNPKFLIHLPLMINRIDVLKALPALLLVFVVSSIIYSPLVIYIHKRNIKKQYDIFKKIHEEDK